MFNGNNSKLKNESEYCIDSKDLQALFIPAVQVTPNKCSLTINDVKNRFSCALLVAHHVKAFKTAEKLLTNVLSEDLELLNFLLQCLVGMQSICVGYGSQLKNKQKNSKNLLELPE